MTILYNNYTINFFYNILKLYEKLFYIHLIIKNSLYKITNYAWIRLPTLFLNKAQQPAIEKHEIKQG